MPKQRERILLTVALIQRDQQRLSLLAMKQLKNISVFLFRNWQ
jgi:hypothetical protein